MANASPKDYVRNEAPRQFPADQGESLTSYGDGEPTIDEGSRIIRDASVKQEAASEKKLRDDAQNLLGKSSPISEQSGVKPADGTPGGASGAKSEKK